MNTQEYIEYLIQQQMNNNQQSPYNPLNGYKNTLDKVNNIGGNLKTTGDFLQRFDNKALNSIGSGMNKAGNYIQGGVSKLTPKFTGLTQHTTTPAIQGALTDALGNAGINIGTNAGMGAIGNAVADSAGSSLAGVGSSIGAESAAGASASGAAGGAAVANPVTALAALGVMALQGANRKRAKQSGESLLKQTNQMAKAVENDTTNQDFANAVVQQAQNNISKGVATGGASPIEEAENVYQGSVLNAQDMPTNTTMSSVMTPDINNAISTNDIYNTPVDNNVQTGQVINNEKVKNGILDKFISGITDFSKGYQENRNTGFSPENLTQDRFAEQTTTNTPSQQLLDYQNKLRNDQDFIKWANNAQKDRETVINNIANGENGGYGAIDEWIKANPDALKPVANTQTTYTGKEKGKMARFGESMGTLARALQNPTFQGLVAGGVGTALTGNPLYGIGLGYKFANQRAMSDAYRDVLKQNGVNVPDTGTFGNVTSQDMKNIGALAEAHNWHQYLNQKNMDELARKIAHDQVLREHYANQDKARQQTADARMISANASKIRADKVGQGGAKGGNKGGSKGGKVTKPQQHPDWKNDLAEYYTLINNPKYATKIPQIKARFMSKYGEDPDKHIKD